MAIFTYSVLTKDGKNKKGKLEANDKLSAINILKESGYYPLNVTGQSTLQKDIVIGNPIKTKDLTVFCQQFESILVAGITVLEALDLLKEQTENKFLKGILTDMYELVESGESLSESMRHHSKYFPSILINMVEAGETSGNLEISFKRMAEHFEKEYKLNQSVKKALMYPIIVSVVAVAVIIILMVVVIPTFVGMFNDLGMELPWTTRFLIAMSNFFVHKWYVLVGGVIIIGTGFFYYSRTEYGKTRLSIIRLKLPILGKVNIKIIASRFSRTLSTLLASGLNLLEAIELVSKVVDNYKVSKDLLDAKNQVSRGIPLSQPIKDMNIFPPMITHMVKIGENTGQLEPILNKVADFYDSEVDTSVSQMTTLIEPIVIVLLALVVGFVVISIIQPMFQMYGGLSSY